MAKKKTLLIIKIAGMKPIESKKTGGWTEKEIKRFVAGVQSGHPGKKVTYSTVSED